MLKKVNRLDEVRAAAIFNTRKRFAEQQAKEQEKVKKLEIAKEIAESRKPKTSKSDAKSE